MALINVDRPQYNILDKPEIQTVIYSYVSNKCKYINGVDLEYKLIFDKVINNLINVDNLIKHKDL